MPKHALNVVFFRVEGINDQSPNSMTLHTGADCTMPATRTMTGTATGNNCDVNTDGNTGCGVQAPTADSYGPSLNDIGGGWYAMERTDTFIQVFFFPRNAGNVPSDLSSGANTINTSNWASRLPASGIIHATDLDDFMTTGRAYSVVP